MEEEEEVVFRLLVDRRLPEERTEEDRGREVEIHLGRDTLFDTAK